MNKDEQVLLRKRKIRRKHKARKKAAAQHEASARARAHEQIAERRKQANYNRRLEARNA